MARPPADPPAEPPAKFPTWDRPSLSALATRPSLRHLTLRFPSLALPLGEYYNRTLWPRAKDFYGYKGREDGVEDGVVNHTPLEGGGGFLGGAESGFKWGSRGG